MNARAPSAAPSATPAATVAAPSSSDGATATATGACLHCGAESLTPFCCAGCATVHALLRDADLGDYYAFRDRLGGRGTPSDDAPPDARFDSPTFERLYCRELGEGRRSTELAIDGLHCAACVWLLERSPRLLPGLTEVRVDFGRARVHLLWEPARVALSEVVSLLRRLGYAAHEAHGQSPERKRASELRSLLIRIGVAGASAGNVMLMSFALYGAGRGAWAMEPSVRSFFQFGSWLASIPALWAGATFLRGAWASLRARVAHMDLPIGLGLVAAFAQGTWSTWSGHGEAYFDSITTLIFLLLIGRYLTRRHQLSGIEASELLHTIVPAWAERVDDETATSGQRIPVEDVKEGDLLLCDSGQVLPVDGVVVRGTSALDTSWLNGEPLPRWVEAGSEVEAGCMNAGAQLLVRATLPAHRSRIASLVADVERALLERSPLATLADVVSGRFTIVVLVLAAVTFGIHVGTAGSAALQHALALLIVACPCALAMATPLALHVAVRQAARREILLLRGEALERLARPCTLILDKTGTLTLGRPTLVRWDGEPALRDVTRVAEARSHHPIARALLDGGTGESASADVTDIREVLGRGVTALYRGQPFSAGSESFVRSGAELDEQAERWLASGPAGASPLLVAWEGRVRAIGWIADPVRPGMAEVLAELRAMGHELVLASGDHPETVAQVAAQLTERSGNAGLFGRVLGGASPDDKRRLAEEAQGRRRTVVVIGDGVNDAAALATADVGIAVHGAAEAARLSADVFLGRNGALDLVALLRSARRGLAVIRRGMFFSLLYNVVGIGAAMLGWLHPLWAAVLMPLSSISVVTNAFRSRIFPAPEKSS